MSHSSIVLHDSGEKGSIFRERGFKPKCGGEHEFQDPARATINRAWHGEA